MMRHQFSNRIAKLQVHGQRRDSPALRMQLGSTISSLDLNPPGMPPSAMLFIRKLKDPSPGQLQSDPGRKSGLSVTYTWRSALRTQLSEHYHNAARPARSTSVGDRNAVLFDDYAELVACFCRDIIDGSQGDRWWWQRYFHSKLPMMVAPGAVASLLTETPRIVPPVMNQLAKWRCAIDLIITIDATDARRILRAMLNEYALAELDDKLSVHDRSMLAPNNGDQVPLIPHALSDRIQTADDADSRTGPSVGDQPRRFEADRASGPPWLNFFRDEAWVPNLGRERTALLGFARMLHDTPLTLRNTQFQKQIVSWWSTPDATDVPPSATGLDAALADHSVIRQQDARIGVRKRGEHRPDDTSTSGISFESSGTGREAAATDAEFHRTNESAAEASRVGNTHGDMNALSGDHQQTEMNCADHGLRKTTPLRHESFDDARAPSSRSSAQDDAAKCTESVVSIYDEEQIAEFDPASADEERCYSDACYVTELAGLLYIINLLNQLELPDCLAEKWKLDQQISRWALLDALARALLDKQFFNYRTDPIWRVLTDLDRRHQSTPVGAGFHGRSDYAMPKAWFQHLFDGADDAFYWASHRGRLRIWSTPGVLLERGSSDHDADEHQVHMELKKFSGDITSAQIHTGGYGQAPLSNVRRLQAAGIDTALAHLLSRLLPPIQRYLQEVLSLPAVTSHALLKKLFHCDGRIFVSSSHIDLVTDINSASLSVRRSGLDQDPGWLPEYGRVVLFHFS